MGEGWTVNRYAAALLGYYAEADSLAPGLSGWLVERAVDPACYAAFPGATELVSGACRLGLRVGIVSDTGFDVRPALERCGLAGSIEAVVLSHEQGASKPAERLFRHACRLLDVPPAQTVLVGDNRAAAPGAIRGQRQGPRRRVRPAARASPRLTHGSSHQLAVPVQRTGDLLDPPAHRRPRGRRGPGHGPLAFTVSSRPTTEAKILPPPTNTPRTTLSTKAHSARSSTRGSKPPRSASARGSRARSKVRDHRAVSPPQRGHCPDERRSVPRIPPHRFLV